MNHDSYDARGRDGELADSELTQAALAIVVELVGHSISVSLEEVDQVQDFGSLQSHVMFAGQSSVCSPAPVGDHSAGKPASSRRRS